jgi:transposase
MTGAWGRRHLPQEAYPILGCSYSAVLTRYPLTPGQRCRIDSSVMETNANSSATRVKARGGRPFHSRLEPFVAFIRELRQRRRTWKEIAESLRSEKNCAISAQGVHQFYRRYLLRLSRPHWERSSAIVSASEEPRRKSVLASTPLERPFRQPKPDSIHLNDPNNL